MCSTTEPRPQPPNWPYYFSHCCIEVVRPGLLSPHHREERFGLYHEMCILFWFVWWRTGRDKEEVSSSSRLFPVSIKAISSSIQFFPASIEMGWYFCSFCCRVLLLWISFQFTLLLRLWFLFCLELGFTYYPAWFAVLERKLACERAINKIGDLGCFFLPIVDSELMWLIEDSLATIFCDYDAWCLCILSCGAQTCVVVWLWCVCTPSCNACQGSHALVALLRHMAVCQDVTIVVLSAPDSRDVWPCSVHGGDTGHQDLKLAKWELLLSIHSQDPALNNFQRVKHL